MEKSILKNISFLNYLAISFFIRGGDAIFKIALILYIINMGALPVLLEHYLYL